MVFKAGNHYTSEIMFASLEKGNKSRYTYKYKLYERLGSLGDSRMPA